MGLLSTGLNCEVVLYLKLLTIKNAILVMLESDLYSEMVLSLRWSQGECSLYAMKGLL